MLIILRINDDEDAGDDDKQSSLDRHVQKPDIAKKEGGLHLGADPWKNQLAILTNLLFVRILGTPTYLIFASYASHEIKRLLWATFIQSSLS